MAPIPDRIKKVISERRDRAKTLIEKYNSNKSDSGEGPRFVPVPVNPEHYKPPKPDTNPRNKRNT